MQAYQYRIRSPLPLTTARQLCGFTYGKLCKYGRLESVCNEKRIVPCCVILAVTALRYVAELWRDEYSFSQLLIQVVGNIGLLCFTHSG